MGLALRLGVLDALLQDVLGLFYELAMQIDGVPIYSADRVILAEDEVRGLFVVDFGRASVSLAFFREFVSSGAVTLLIGIVSLIVGIGLAGRPVGWRIVNTHSIKKGGLLRDLLSR